MPNSDHETLEYELSQSSATSSTNFCSESDSSSSTGSSESQTDSDNSDLRMQIFSFFQHNSWNSHFFTIFWAIGIQLSFPKLCKILLFSTWLESYAPILTLIFK